MSLLVAGISAFVAAIIQRVTGMGFVLVLIGPAVLLYGALDGGTVALVLALVASLVAIPLMWRDIDWRRAWRLIWPGLLAAPLGGWVARVLPEPVLLLVMGAMAVFALVAGHLSGLSVALRGRRGAWLAGAAGGFMNATSGLGGPPLAAHAVGDRWAQRAFAASVQVVFIAFDVVSIPLRGLPAIAPVDVVVLAVVTAIGIGVGTLVARIVPPHRARIAMLVIAWAGATVVLVRGVAALWG